MDLKKNEQELLKSVALQNARAILLARKRAEGEALEAKQRLANILESITDGFFALDTGWRFTYFNSKGQELLAPLQGGAGVVLGELFSDSYPGLAGTELETKLRQAVNEQTTLCFETFLPPLQKWLEIRAYPAAEGLSVYFSNYTERKEQERARAHLASVVESSDDAILTMGLDTIISSWNKGARRMFGYTAEEAVGLSITMLIPAGQEDEEPRILNRLLQGERIDHYETIRVRKDGGRLNVSLTVSPIYDAFGKIAGVSKILRDITELKRHQEDLRRNEEELRVLANTIPQLAWVAGPEGEITWFNQRWYEYTGTSFEEMAGWGWESVHDPEILPTVLVNWRRSIATGTPFEMEFPLKGSDGVFRWFLTRVTPVKNSEGKVLRWFGTNMDVHEVRRAQLALKEETRLLELLNNTGKAIAAQLDTQKLVQTVTDSATELTGAQFGAFFYNIVDERGESFLLFSLSGAPREAFEKFGNPRATPLFGPTFRGEPPIRSDDVRKDPRYGQMPPHDGMPKGHLPVVSYLAVPVISRSGEVMGGLFFGHSEPGVFTERAEKLVVGMAAQAAVALDNARLFNGAQREITERTRVEKALRLAQAELHRHADKLEAEVAERTARLRETIQELEAFSYSVSHDMRTPLRAMQGYSAVLLEEHSDQLGEAAKEYLRRIGRSSSRLDLLIQDVLAYSRVAQGDIHLAEVNVEHVIREVVQNYPALQPDQASIVIRERIPPILGHEAYLTQIVSNLLCNAVKFVPPDTFPSILITTEVEDGVVRIDFKDNGIGIAEEHLDQIFQMFGRVYSENRFEGTGIGLAITKKAAERMGGSVRVQSAPGCGSTFSVFLNAF